MGCDIHLVGERLYIRPDGSTTGRWKVQLEHQQWRNYDLFALLAGVRQDPDAPVVPIADPRGFPADMSSDEIAAKSREFGGHHQSWLTLLEAEAACGIAPDFDALLDYLAATNDPERGVGHYEVRLVFFFDN